MAIPLLTSKRFGSLSQIEAQATVSPLNASTCVFGAAAATVYNREAVLAQVALITTIGASLFSPVGVLFGRRLADKTLRRIFSAGLIAMAPLTVLKPILVEWKKNNTDSTSSTTSTTAMMNYQRFANLTGITVQPSGLVYLLAMGSGVGFLSGITGFGAGTLMTTALSLGFVLNSEFFLKNNI